MHDPTSVLNISSTPFVCRDINLINNCTLCKNRLVTYLQVVQPVLTFVFFLLRRLLAGSFGPCSVVFGVWRLSLDKSFLPGRSTVSISLCSGYAYQKFDVEENSAVESCTKYIVHL